LNHGLCTLLDAPRWAWPRKLSAI